MKAKNETYESLAKQLSMSSSGLKKLFAAKDCSLNKLVAICSVLNIDINELLKSSETIKSTEINFSKVQEDFFIKNPNHFYFFWELIDNDMSLDKLRSLYGLNEISIKRYLMDLDKMGLIELHPGDKIKHAYSGKTHWNMGASEIGQKAMIEFQDGFLKKLRKPSTEGKNKKVLRWVNFQLRKETYNDLMLASQDLIRDFKGRAEREKPLSTSEELIPVGLLFGMMNFSYPDILKIPNITLKSKPH